MSDDSSNAASDTEQEKQPTTIADDIVVTKYKMASEITNKVLKEIVEKCVDKTSVMSLCELGDNRLLEETGKVFKKEKNLKKGASLSHLISHHFTSPLFLFYFYCGSFKASRSRLVFRLTIVFATFRLSRATLMSFSRRAILLLCTTTFSLMFFYLTLILLICFLLLYSDLGCHIDGFIAVAAHTLVIGATKVIIILPIKNEIFSENLDILGFLSNKFQGNVSN